MSIFISLEFGDIVSRVQQQDLEKENARVIAEKDKRKELQVATHGTNAFTASELLKKLTDTGDSSKDDESVLKIPTGKQELPNDYKPTGFPLPPKGPTSGGG